MHNKSCCDICAPKILYLATIDSSKCGLKNSTKLQKSKGSVAYTTKAFKCREFIPGDLVLRKVLGNTRDPTMGKLGPNWEGPY